MYVIRRTDQEGGWVTSAGSHHSYTPYLQNARRYATRAEAEADRCGGNERTESVEDAMKTR